MNGDLLVLAPHGRDAVVIAQVLERAGLHAEVCATLEDLVARIDRCASAVVTQEALTGAALVPLAAWIARQPPWSDLPFILLVARQIATIRPGRAVSYAAAIGSLGNAVLLERPLNAESLVSATQSALRARQRQLAMRDLTQSLESRVDDRTRALRASEKRFRAVFEGFPGCLFVIRVTEEADFVYEGYNPAGERRTGLRSQEVTGLPPEAFMAKAQAAALRVVLNRCLQSGSSETVTEELHFPAGSGTFEMTLTPLRDGDGNIVRILGVATDVTERNVLESRLRQSQKLEAIGRLTGGVAHDFNNLLQVVLSGLTLLERVQEPARRVQLSESVRRAAQRGGELTKRLLTIARRQSLQPEPIDLDTWLNDGAAELLARTLRGDIATQLRIAPGLPPVQVDPEELELALLNLAVNARDAMADGGTLTIGADAVTLDGSAEADGLAGRFVRLSVADTGTGMTAATQARVFEPFFTTKEVGKGTGLGLAQVYGFAKQTGGGVRLHSVVGEGTTVSLLLPVSLRAARQPVHLVEQADDPPTLGAAVLVVEDDDEVAALVVQMLTQLGQRPTRVSTAAAALGALADNRTVDLLFTDVLMPGGMDGLALAREARRRRPGLLVLLTTGYADEGANDVPPGVPMLRKPYRIDELAAALQRVLTQHPEGILAREEE